MNRSIPRSTVIPELGYSDIEKAIHWLCDAFGFTVRMRVGDHRAQLNVGEAAIVVMQGGDDSSKESEEQKYRVLIRVEDADQLFERAKRHGARILRPPTDYPFGERQFTVVDYAGHVWTFSQSIADVAPEEWGGASFKL